MLRKSVAAALIVCLIVSACVTPKDVTLMGPVSGMEIVSVDGTGKPIAATGILVDKIEPGSPAAETDVRSADRIVSIDGEVPLTAAHAMALMADKTETEIAVIGADGIGRTALIRRRGLFGLSFKNEIPVSNTLKASGPATTVLVTHRDYRPFSETLKATEAVPGRQSMRSLGGVYTGLGAALTFVGIILKAVLQPPETYNYSTRTYERQDNFFNPGDFFLPLGIGIGGIGIIALANGYAKTYPVNYTIAQGKFAESALYDADGYNLVTGIDRYGITKDGRYPDGTRFEGSIVKGSREGYGVLIRADGKAGLAGTFNAGELNGLGMELALMEPDVRRLAYLGFFEASRRNGLGIVFDESERPARLVVYEKGSEKTSQPYPAGPIIESTALLFLGDGFKEGRADGKGLALTVSGRDTQEGIFSKGELIEGIKKYADGTVLRGRFTGGAMVQGVYKSSDGSGGEGIWKNGVLQSPAKLLFPDGRVYSGAFDSNGLPHGEGSMAYPNGDLYMGSFIRGVPEGRGTYSFKSGTTYTGELVGGTFQGKGKQVKPNGEIYEGDFIAGLPHGMGYYKFGDTVERAEYYEGKRIDQAYLIREEREKARIERARLAELEEERQREAEERRREEERRRAEAERKAEEDARAQQRNKTAFAAVLGTGTGLFGLSKGLDVGEAVYLGSSVAADVLSDSVGKDSSMTNKAMGDILSARQAQASLEAKSRTDSGRFNEKPAPAAGTHAGYSAAPKAPIPIAASPQSAHLSQTKAPTTGQNIASPGGQSNAAPMAGSSSKGEPERKEELKSIPNSSRNFSLKIIPEAGPAKKVEDMKGSKVFSNPQQGIASLEVSYRIYAMAGEPVKMAVYKWTPASGYATTLPYSTVLWLELTNSFGSVCLPFNCTVPSSGDWAFDSPGSPNKDQLFAKGFNGAKPTEYYSAAVSVGFMKEGFEITGAWLGF